MIYIIITRDQGVTRGAFYIKCVSCSIFYLIDGSSFTEHTVFILAPLADEYRMEFLKRDCVKIFKQMIKTSACPLKTQLDIYFFVETYIGSQDVLQFCAAFLSQFRITNIMQQSVYGKIQQKGIILEKRLEMIEKVTTVESVCSVNANLAELKNKCRYGVNKMPEVKQQWDNNDNRCPSCKANGGYIGRAYRPCISCVTNIYITTQSLVSKMISEIRLKPKT